MTTHIYLTCDRCGANQTPFDAPWAKLQFARQPRETTKAMDLCAKCAGGFEKFLDPKTPR